MWDVSQGSQPGPPRHEDGGAVSLGEGPSVSFNAHHTEDAGSGACADQDEL